MPPEPLDHLAHLARVQEEFLATLGAVDPDTRVPWCGRWRVRDLAVHLARVHHWAAAEARRTTATSLGRGPFDLTALYGRCAAELRDTLVELGPDAPSSTLEGRGPASFWRRRQLHETLVHLWDLRTAGGLPLDEDPAVWADTVEEVVTVLQPRQVRLKRMPRLPQPIELQAADVPRTWRLDSTADGPARVVVQAPAADLALLLWGRRGPEGAPIQVSGDVAVLRAALELRLTP